MFLNKKLYAIKSRFHSIQLFVKKHLFTSQRLKIKESGTNKSCLALKDTTLDEKSSKSVSTKWNKRALTEESDLYSMNYSRNHYIELPGGEASRERSYRKNKTSFENGRPNCIKWSLRQHDFQKKALKKQVYCIYTILA